jgi:hypothetical protein
MRKSDGQLDKEYLNLKMVFRDRKRTFSDNFVLGVVSEIQIHATGWRA